MKIIIEDDRGTVEFKNVVNYVLVVEHSGGVNELISNSDQIYLGFAAGLTQKVFYESVNQEDQSPLS